MPAFLCFLLTKQGSTAHLCLKETSLPCRVVPVSLTDRSQGKIRLLRWHCNVSTSLARGQAWQERILASLLLKYGLEGGKPFQSWGCLPARSLLPQQLGARLSPAHTQEQHIQKDVQPAYWLACFNSRHCSSCCANAPDQIDIEKHVSLC